MDLIRGLFRSSSQRAPTVKVEENTDSANPDFEAISTRRRGISETEGEEGEAEAKGNIDLVLEEQEGRNEEQRVKAAKIKAENSTNTKRKRKQKKVAKQSKAATRELEDENALEPNPVLEDVTEPRANGHFEVHFQEELEMEESSKVNGRIKTNRAAPTVNATAEVGEPGGPASLLNGASTSKGTVKTTKSRKSRRKVAETYIVPEPDSLQNVDAGSLIQDEPLTEVAEFSQRIERAKKAKSRSVSDGPSTILQKDHNDSQARLIQRLALAPISFIAEHNSQEDILAASSQFQKGAQSHQIPGSVNGEDEEQSRLPSSKALGKRKAVDEQGPQKKIIRRKDKVPLSRDLRGMGFRSLPTSDEVSGSRLARDGSATSNQSRSPISDLARRLYKGDQQNSTEAPHSLALPTASSKNPAEKTEAAPAFTEKNPQKPRPSWNAINFPLEPDAQDDQNDSENSLFLPAPEESEYVQELEPEPAAPKSSERHKRRLPVDEYGSSTVNENESGRPKSEQPSSKIRTTLKVKEKGLRAAPTFKGKLKAEEIDAIEAAVESYRILKDMTEDEIKDLIHSDAQQKAGQDLWKAVCDEVPDIPRRNVLRMCRRRFNNFERKWTEEQDEELRRANEMNPGKWKLIGQTLNRSPEDVRDRWRNYVVCGDTLLKDYWKREEEEHLRSAVQQCMRAVRQIRELSGEPATSLIDTESLIDWQRVSELMGRTRSRLQCSNKWKKLIIREETGMGDPVATTPTIESWRLREAALKARSFSAVEKLRFLCMIRDSGAAREGKIPWASMRIDLNDQGNRMAWKLCFSKLKDNVPGHESMEFKDVVAHLVHAFEEAAPGEPSGYEIHVESSKRTRKPRLKDNGEGSSTGQKARSREPKQVEPQHAEGAGAKAPVTKKKQKIRNRMLKQGESQETVEDNDESVSIDDDVVDSLQSLKRGLPTGRRTIRKSKRNQPLSEEKVIEDPSDDEGAIANGNMSQFNEDEMVMDAEEAYTTSSGPEADEEAHGQQIETDSLDLDADHATGTNGSNDNESVDLDTASRDSLENAFKKRLVSPHVTNGYASSEADSSSDYDSMSSIPAKTRSRMESMEL